MKTADEIINDLRNGRHVEYRTISHVMLTPEKHLAVLVDHAFAGEVIGCIEQLVSRLAQVERERDEALRDIPRACGYCKHFIGHEFIPHCYNMECKNISGINTGWEWRGVCAENTEGV